MEHGQVARRDAFPDLSEHMVRDDGPNRTRNDSIQETCALWRGLDAFRQPVMHTVVEHQLASVRCAVGIGQPGKPHRRDLRQRILPQRPVGDELQTADEGGREVFRKCPAQRLMELVLVWRRVGHGRLLHDRVPGVRREDDQSVREVRLDPLGILHPPPIEDLVEHLDHIGMRLLDLVQQHHAVGRTPDAFGQHAAFAISDVPGRRPLQSRHRMRFLVLGHVDGQKPASEQHIGDGVRGLRLPDPRRAAEHERSHGPPAVGQAGEIGMRLRSTAGQGVLLPDDAFSQCLFEIRGDPAHIRQHAANRYPGQIRDHRRDVILHHGDRAAILLLPAVVILRPGLGGDTSEHSGPSTRRIQHHHRLVGKPAPDHVTTGERDGGLQDILPELDRMVAGEHGGDPFDDAQRIRIVGLLNPHRSDPPCEPRIRLDVTAPLAPAAGPDDPHRAIAQHAAKRVSALALVREQEVDVVDIEKHPRVLDLSDDGLETFFQGTADHRPGPKRGDIQRPYRRVVQNGRHGCSAVGQSVDEPDRARRFSDARFADHDDRVLSPPQQDGRHRLDLRPEADHRIEAPTARNRDHVPAIAGELRVLPVGRRNDGCGVSRTGGSARARARYRETGEIQTIQPRQHGHEAWPHVSSPYDRLEAPDR